MVFGEMKPKSRDGFRFCLGLRHFYFIASLSIFSSIAKSGDDGLPRLEKRKRPPLTYSKSLPPPNPANKKPPAFGCLRFLADPIQPRLEAGDREFYLLTRQYGDARKAFLKQDSFVGRYYVLFRIALDARSRLESRRLLALKGGEEVIMVSHGRKPEGFTFISLSSGEIDPCATGYGQGVTMVLPGRLERGSPIVKPRRTLPEDPYRVIGSDVGRMIFFSRPAELRELDLRTFQMRTLFALGENQLPVAYFSADHSLWIWEPKSSDPTHHSQLRLIGTRTKKEQHRLELGHQEKILMDASSMGTIRYDHSNQNLIVTEWPHSPSSSKSIRETFIHLEENIDFSKLHTQVNFLKRMVLLFSLHSKSTDRNRVDLYDLDQRKSIFHFQAEKGQRVSGASMDQSGSLILVSTEWIHQGGLASIQIFDVKKNGWRKGILNP